jgi:hypothetical protein
MSPGGPEYLIGGQVPALEAEKIAGAGEIRVPTDAEMGAAKAVGRTGGEFR